MRCPYCRTDVTRGAISCPKCRAQITYGCTVPATGCLLTIVVAFLTGGALIGVLAGRDAAGGGTISSHLLIGIAIFSILLGLGLWILMTHIAKSFVSFSRKRPE